jgi:hypothetical protein
MKKSASATATIARGGPTEVQAVRDAADALFRAATECCRQHDRMSRIVGKSELEEELTEVQKMCETCSESLSRLTKHYQDASASVHPTGTDERWWRSANSLWLASKEYLSRHRGCDTASRQLKNHGPERLGALHTEYELEASALLALQHAADAYKRDRPIAA